MKNQLEIENSEPIPTPTPLITAALVERVSQRIAKGISLELALAGESVTEEDYKVHLKQNPEFAAIEDAAKCRFIEDAIGGLMRVENPSTNIRWLLERVYPEIFGSRRGDQDAAPEEKPRNTIGGMSEEELRELQAQALLL